MKSMFGFGVFLLFLAGIALVMLQGRQMSIGGGGAELTGVQWRAVSVGEQAIADDSGVFIQFEVDGSKTHAWRHGKRCINQVQATGQCKR